MSASNTDTDTFFFKGVGVTECNLVFKSRLSLYENNATLSQKGKPDCQQLALISMLFNILKWSLISLINVLSLLA